MQKKQRSIQLNQVDYKNKSNWIIGVSNKSVWIQKLKEALLANPEHAQCYCIKIKNELKWIKYTYVILN